MNCTIDGCPGEYEQRNVTHTVRRDGQVLVIDGVPAEVCSICGDALLAPDTIRRLERILASLDQPHKTVPLYEFA